MKNKEEQERVLAYRQAKVLSQEELESVSGGAGCKLTFGGQGGSGMETVMSLDGHCIGSGI